ncbi:MAG: hypothetical protein M9894_35685 [Planctomycetes bacterium]|nr:hypothetical protein [Planctomycetota bacterium]
MGEGARLVGEALGGAELPERQGRGVVAGLEGQGAAGQLLLGRLAHLDVRHVVARDPQGAQAADDDDRVALVVDDPRSCARP